ncbi:MAG TPA: peptidylprolyl isomerase [Vicinamibacterales bacterium]|jgi:peptidyl-prolyl cis-trans isomerase B (cyclophilin B)
MSRILLIPFVLVGLLGQTPARRPAAPAPFKTPLTAAQMATKQAVVETSAGTFIVDLRPDLAPNHVGYFIKLAEENAFAGTTFHRMVRNGIIQGGDPLSKDPAKKSQYGTGGLGVLQAETSSEPFTAGTVAAAIRPRDPNSGGAQFFVCASDQPALTGQYTAFGRVSEGLEVVRKISETPTDENGLAQARVEITKVTIRDTPPPEPVPFATDTVEQLAQYRAVLETSMGTITVAFIPDKAPEHVRNFLKLAQAGVFDGTSFHRVVPGFVVQTGYLSTRGPLTQKQQAVVHNLQPEFNDVKHVKGILSMARGDDPASATTSFFIVIGDSAPSLDGKYTVFGRVVEGLEVVDKIAQVPLNGEAPVTRVDLVRVRPRGPGVR